MAYALSENEKTIDRRTQALVVALLRRHFDE
jgi:hypothetical protein